MIVYRGYTIEPGSSLEPSYDIKDKDGCLIDGAPSHLEAEEIIDEWMSAP